jgi:UDP-glucose 4-epimerase
VISIFTELIAAGRGITIYGDGGQTRDFVHVADVVAALLAAMALRPADAPVFNVCTGLATSVLDLAHLIAELCGRSAEITHGAPRAGEIRHSLGVPDTVNAILRLSSHRSLREGLGDVLAWLGDGRH